MAPNVSQLQSIYNYLQTSGVGASATSSNDNYLNTIWSSIQDVQNVADGSEQQKASGIQNLLKKVLSLIESAAGSNNESKKASTEVKSNGADARDLTTEASQTEQEIIAQIEAIQKELQGHIDVITAATLNIEGKKEELEAQLQALKSIQETITEKQEELKQLDPSSPDYKKQATKLLNDIKTFAGLIPAITGTLSSIQETLNLESQNVANAYSAVEVLKGNAVEVQTNGEAEIVALSSKAIQEVQDNAQSQVVANTENVPTAQAAQQAGQAAGSNMFTATEAPKLFMVSTDQQIASTTRITGATTNLQTLQQGIGRINSTNEKLTGFSGSLEDQLNTFNNAIGSWNERIAEPTIVSIGSMNFDDIASAGEELVAAVDADLGTLGALGGTDEGSNNSSVVEPQPKSQLQTIGFDLKRLGINEDETGK